MALQTKREKIKRAYYRQEMILKVAGVIRGGWEVMSKQERW